MAAANAEKHAVILFDGVCNLCNGFVNFVIDRDAAGYFKFAALQSDAAEALLDAEAMPAVRPPNGRGRLQSVVLIEDGRVYRRSTAALRIARRLRGPWSLLAVLLVMPRPLRDAIYDGLAQHRYEWFGRRDRCRVPTPALEDRFL